MPSQKISRAIHILCLLAAFPILIFAQDISNSQDHPLITRYPGQTIRGFDVKQHRGRNSQKPSGGPGGPIGGRPSAPVRQTGVQILVGQGESKLVPAPNRPRCRKLLHTSAPGMLTVAD